VKNPAPLVLVTRISSPRSVLVMVTVARESLRLLCRILFRYAAGSGALCGCITGGNTKPYCDQQGK